MITGKISNFIGFDITKIEDYVKDIDKDIMNLFTATQGRISFGSGTDGSKGENISGEFQVYTTNAIADTEDTLAHTLGVVPIGYIVIKIDKGGVIYDSGTAWTSTNIYLKCSVASATVTLFLLK